MRFRHYRVAHRVRERRHTERQFWRRRGRGTAVHARGGGLHPHIQSQRVARVVTSGISFRTQIIHSIFLLFYLLIVTHYENLHRKSPKLDLQCSVA